MKNIMYLLVFLSLIRCGTTESNRIFEDEWYEKDYQREIISISKEGDIYLVEEEGKKYPAELKEKMLEISAGFPLKAIIDSNDYLILDGKEYIRKKNSQRVKMNGLWQSTHDLYGFCKLMINTEMYDPKVDVIDASCEHYGFDFYGETFQKGTLYLVKREFGEEGPYRSIQCNFILESDTTAILISSEQQTSFYKKISN